MFRPVASLGAEVQSVLHIESALRNCPMNTAPRALIRTLLLAALPLVTVSAQPSLTESEVISALWDAPLSLPRLSHNAHRLGSKPVDRDTFEVMSLSEEKHANVKSRGGTPYLEISPNDAWVQKLRFRGDGVSYVSFTLNASIGTVVNIGGAAFTIGQSVRDPAFASVSPVGSKVRINQEMPWLLYSGKRMAPLNIVTVKIDHKTSTWAIWFRDMLMANDVPITRDGAPNSIKITAGKGGAWLCGLVSSDENPLFEDVNSNTVPDKFERDMLGRLLEPNAPEQTKASLRAVWLEERISRPASRFVLNAPLPDSFPELCSPEGEFVHGMTGGMKFGPRRKK